MDKDTVLLAIVGLGITLGFLGFLAYLIAQSKQQACPEPTPTYISIPTRAPQQQQEKVVETEEIRPTRPHIINHVLNEADRWYEIRLPVDAITWQLRARGNYDLLYSFEPSHATYMTLTRGDTLTEDTAPHMGIKSIYVMCETAGVTSELEVWRNHA